MQLERNQMRRASTLRPLIAALAAAAGCAAWADEPNPYYIGASESFTHDSNVYRASKESVNGVAPAVPPNGYSDNYWSTGLLAGFDQSISRQHIYGSGNIRYNKYQEHDSLNNTSYGLNLGLDWATVNDLSGNVNASANRSLALLNGNGPLTNGNQVSTARNLVTTDQVNAGLRWGGQHALNLTADYSHSRVNFTDQPTGDSTGDSASVGGTYRVGPSLRLGTALRFTRTRSPFGSEQIVDGEPAFAPLTSNGKNLDLLADWTYSEQTGVNARLSWTRQTNAGGEGRDFSGLTGDISAHYAPTAKLSFSADYSRDAGNYGSFFNGTNGTASNTTSPTLLSQNAQTSDTFSLSGRYAATAKIGVTASTSYRHTKSANSFNGLDGGDSTDRFQNVSLGIDYAIARNWQLGCNIAHETRRDSTVGVGYSDNSASCSAQVTLR
jgi:hypothetical protein